MKRLLATLPALLLATPALAHLDPAEHGSLMAGATHPLFGADHLLAMVAVGLLAATRGGQALYALPLAFVGAMLAGFVLALVGLPLPLVEPTILASVIVLGAVVAAALRLPVPAMAAVVAAFGLFHGFAHGGEMGGAGALAYAAGFAVATAALHGAGIMLGRGLLTRLAAAKGALVLRGLGLATMFGGLAIAVG
ncbi:HupE/UreJ family protein [Fertoebacter nigrum]|uniref:HupE/UreJ family protein n=1 Tax=Fertoeibacter niger TaxID=2656921 RepID=A0A8X8KQ69_9RHOB|nr:HupE/UreJ family protein [Fertoeibacter niger]NUB45885.1 HupE/UreJ family protein [Fertoeibacter niger]